MRNLDGRPVPVRRGRPDPAAGRAGGPGPGPAGATDQGNRRPASLKRADFIRSQAVIPAEAVARAPTHAVGPANWPHAGIHNPQLMILSMLCIIQRSFVLVGYKQEERANKAEWPRGHIRCLMKARRKRWRGPASRRVSTLHLMHSR
ncbi:hypothetical protein BO1005MUT1_210070 [Hyphomicrobiales bacterium]|nr:hypothetical protein BO1005MUT1_210070 [Hyphomicrobiales bacterium]